MKFSKSFLSRCVVATSCLVVDVVSFCNRKVPAQTFLQQNNNHKRSLRNTFQYQALVFGCDGERSDDEYTSIDYIPDYYHEAGSPLAEKLTVDPNQLGSLAKLACAFSPPGHSLSLQDVEHVRVISVDENHIEISAVVCEEEGCVTILVPVQFPHECGGTFDMEECVLDNIVDLDHQAEEVLKEKAKLSELETEDAIAEWCELKDNGKLDGEDLPAWWIAPSSCTRGMEEECALVRQLLNNAGFQEEVKALAQRGLESMPEIYSMGAEFTVERAAVVAVGPAGFYLRAKISIRRSILDDVEIRKINIPFAFSRNEVIWSAEDLRAAVLGAVASASSMNI